MGAIADYWKSERGLVAVSLIIAATVLTALGHMTVDGWKEFSVLIFGIYAGSKTITGAIQIAKGSPAPAADPSSKPAGVSSSADTSTAASA